MNIRTTKLVRVQIGTQRQSFLPHHVLKVEDTLAKKLLTLHPGLVRKVK